MFSFLGLVNNIRVEFKVHDGSRQELAKSTLYMKLSALNSICASKRMANGHTIKFYSLLIPGEVFNSCMFCHFCVKSLNRRGLCSEWHAEDMPVLCALVEVCFGVLAFLMLHLPHTSCWGMNSKLSCTLCLSAFELLRQVLAQLSRLALDLSSFCLCS